MKVQTKDIYYGIALSQIAEYPTYTSINKIMEKEGMFQINDDKQILIKYATKSDKSGEWRFTFHKGDLDEFPAFGSFIVLVCELNAICLLPLDSIAELIDVHSKTSQWVSVYYPSGGQMRVRGSKGEFKNTIPHNDFPMKIFEEVTKQQEAYSWPPFSTLKFYRHPPELIFSSHDRRLNLSDNLTKNVTIKKGRTLYCGISTISNDWKIWNEKNLKKVEADIRNDLGFDGYNVNIERVTSAVCPVTKKKDIPCNTEFLWKLTISAAT